MILIGSTAIKKLYPDFPRNPKDTDYAINERNTVSDKSIEYLYNPVLFSENIKELNGNQLLTLKASHLFWDINWDKHMFDCQFLIKKGHKIEQDLFYKLYGFWNEYHGSNKRSKLNMSSFDFFNNVVKCPYDHDWLHTLLKEYPTYKKILKDNEEVDVSEEKFNVLTFEEKKSLVVEEVMVMSFERKFHKDYRHSYSIMLKKFIISHAPIWEALWIIENYISLIKPEFDYFKLLNQKIENYGKTN